MITLLLDAALMTLGLASVSLLLGLLLLRKDERVWR